MAIYLAQNPYAGINPHWNSLVQSQYGSWSSFHSALINKMQEDLDSQLPTGYLTLPEQGLQIKAVADPDGDGNGHLLRSRPDITISQCGPSGGMALAAASTPTYTIELNELLDEDEFWDSLTIYQQGEGPTPYGRPITRIELLSPANKPRGSYYAAYRQKRLEALGSGMRLIELDYLHETPPILPRIANYSTHQEGAAPYHIIVSDPRPTPAKGHADFYHFGVMDAIPTVLIPLAGSDSLVFDFGHAYHRLYSTLRAAHAIVDYSEMPINVEAYTPADQTLIRQKMTEIAQSQAQ